MSRKSKSNWEDSFFGGYNQILWDYPTITLDNSVDFDLDRKTYNDLGYYRGNTLAKLFLLKVSEYKLSDTLVVNAKWEEKQSQFYRAGGQTLHEYKADYHGIKAALDSIIILDSELSNLFKHYYNDIISLAVTIEVNPDQGIDEVMRALGNTKTFSYKNKFTSNSVSTGSLKNDTKFIQAASSNKTTYTKSQVRKAGDLARILDINFDPTYTKLTSLRSGKLDSGKIAECVPGNTNIYYNMEEKLSTKPFKVCILCDESGSMNYYQSGGKKFITIQKELVKILFKAFSETIDEKDIYVYGHTGYQTPEIYIYNDPYNLTFEDRIEDMSKRVYNENYDGPVIESIYEKIRSQTEDNILLITISDGCPSGYGYGGGDAILEMKKIIEKCKRDGFVTMGIGLADQTVEEIYNYNVVVEDVERDLVKRVSSLVNNVVKTEFQN